MTYLSDVDPLEIAVDDWVCLFREGWVLSDAPMLKVYGLVIAINTWAPGAFINILWFSGPFGHVSRLPHIYSQHITYLGRPFL